MAKSLFWGHTLQPKSTRSLSSGAILQPGGDRLCFPSGSWILLLPKGDRLFVVDFLFLDHGLPASCAGVADFVMWGSRRRHLGRLTRVTD